MFVTTTVKATSASRATKFTAFFSRDRKGDRADIRLGGRIAVGSLDAGALSSVNARVDVPATALPGSYYVIACPGVTRTAAVAGCVAAAAKTQVTAGATTTRALLAAAVQRHEITEQQALVYRVFGAFGDPRIPTRYVGDDSGTDGDSVMTEVMAQWPSLTAKTRATLAPFFEPPAAKGSWANGAAPATAAASDAGSLPMPPPCDDHAPVDKNWDHLDSENGKARFSWRKGENAAAQSTRAAFLARELDDVIWPKLSALFAPNKPVPDNGVGCFNGGDGRLDIYFTPIERAYTLALTIPYTDSFSKAPVYVLLKEDVDPIVLAHEITHVFQFTYAYKSKPTEYVWFMEASATWGADYLYPNDNFEHTWRALLERPHTAFENLDYDDWSFVLWIDHLYGEETIPRTFKQFGKADSLPAIDKAIGTFKSAWPQFARYAWNQDPITDSFKAWDHFDAGPKADGGAALPITPIALGGKSSSTTPVHISIQPLARDYQRFALSDDNVRYLKVTNTVFGLKGGAIQALLKRRDGQWVTQDWTARPSIEFCRDKAEEDFTEVVLIVSHSDYTSHQYLEPLKDTTIEARDRCDTFPYYYRVLAYSFEEHTSGSQENPLFSCGTNLMSGTDDHLGALPAPAPESPAGKLEPLAGGFTGHIRFTMPANSSRLANMTRQGCKLNGTTFRFDIPCSVTYPDFYFTTSSTAGVDFYAGTNETMIRVAWPITTAPGVGNIANPTDAGCNVGFGGGLPIEETVFTYVPITTLKQTLPITLTNAGQQHLEEGFGGKPIDLTFSWSSSLTLQRVDADGKPLE